MKVNEIFYSIEGEGIRAGYPCVFIRLTGCNLRCSYCDSQYAFTEGNEMTVEDIVNAVLSCDCPRVTITGGEPLLSAPMGLLDALFEKDIEVNIETNGSIDPKLYMMTNTIITMDYKLPSSGMEHKMDPSFIESLRGCDVLKFVVGDKFDVIRAIEVLKEHPTEATVFFSPVFGKLQPYVIVNFLKENHLDARIQLQLQKVIYDPETRGV